MKKMNVKPGMFLLGSALCLIALGIWTVRHGRAGASEKDTLKNVEALADLPVSSGKTPTDQEIARWAGAAKRNAQDERAWANLGDALMQKARETADTAYYAHAERVYRKSLELKPENVSAITGLAWVYGARHEFEKSMEWANRAVALDPKNHAAYGLIGDAAVEMGDYAAAFEHYQKMLDTRPDISSYSRGAHLLFLTGDARKGMWLMGKAIRAGGPYAENTAWCRAQLGLMLYQTGNLLAAEQTLKAALKQTPDNYHLLAAMGKVMAARKDYPKAMDFYKKAVAIAPQIEPLAALGDLYRLTGAREKAEEQYRTVEAIHRLQKANGVRGDMLLARFYADHDRNLPEALRMAEEEYRTRKNAFAADTLAWCLYKNGRYEEARKRIADALRRRTPEASFHYHAGIIHAKLGNRPMAQEYLYRALSLNPGFSPVDAPRAAETLKRLGAGLSTTQQAKR